MAQHATSYTLRGVGEFHDVELDDLSRDLERRHVDERAETNTAIETVVMNNRHMVLWCVVGSLLFMTTVLIAVLVGFHIGRTTRR